jgi:hypothetical protein
MFLTSDAAPGGGRVQQIRVYLTAPLLNDFISKNPLRRDSLLQVLEASQPVIAQQAHRDVEHLDMLYRQMLGAIAQHRVADRPDRFEPRMTKRRPNNYDRLTRPRKGIKREMAEQFSKTEVPFVDPTEAG